MESPAEELSYRRRPGTYLITFCCDGKWLPGQSGAIDRSHNFCGGRSMPESLGLERHARATMSDHPAGLTELLRAVVLEAILEVCEQGGWTPVAAHVRSDHVHAVVGADADPATMMVVFKRYASRALNRRYASDTNRRWWARHGSTRYLWTNDDVQAAVRYVVDGQGRPMAYWVNG